MHSRQTEKACHWGQIGIGGQQYVRASFAPQSLHESGRVTGQEGAPHCSMHNAGEAETGGKGREGT